jgi:AcrR family transcriptional regulator
VPVAPNKSVLSSPPTEAVGKGASTRQRILARALEIAGQRGLEGLTIGDLAIDLKMSKSGLFAHFKSKERLQLEVLEAAAQAFGQQVFVPAFTRPRGLERLGAIFDNWLKWIRSNHTRQGCIFMAGAMEWDDRDGPVRDALVHWFEALFAALEKAAQLAVDAGQLRADLDVEGFAHDLDSIALKYHLDTRLLRSPKALKQARRAYQRLLSSAQT